MNRDINYFHAKARFKSENTIGLMKNKFKVTGSTIRLKTIKNIVLVLKSIIPIHYLIIEYQLQHVIDNTSSIEDDFQSDFDNVQEFRQHRALNLSNTIEAHKRRERMKLTNV